MGNHYVRSTFGHTHPALLEQTSPCPSHRFAGKGLLEGVDNERLFKPIASCPPVSFMQRRRSSRALNCPKHAGWSVDRNVRPLLTNQTKPREQRRVVILTRAEARTPSVPSIADGQGACHDCLPRWQRQDRRNTRSREKHDIRLGTSYHQVSLTQNLTCEVSLG